MRTFEHWRDVVGYEGLYMVSDEGQVLSCRGKGRELKQATDNQGRKRVNLYSDNGPANLKVHNLVALAFIGPRQHGEVVRHLDGNPGHNSLLNLAYGTQAQNVHDAIRHGTIKAALSDDDVAEIRSRHGTESQSSLSRRFGVKVKIISDIQHGRRRKYVEPTGHRGAALGPS